MNKKISGNVSGFAVESKNTKFSIPQGIEIFNIRANTNYLKDVKISDGDKNVLTDDKGKYEIETSKTTLEFSKNGFESKTMEISKLPIDSQNSIIYSPTLIPSTEQNKNVGGNKKILGFEKSRFFIILGVVAILCVGLMVVIPKLKNK